MNIDGVLFHIPDKANEAAIVKLEGHGSSANGQIHQLEISYNATPKDGSLTIEVEDRDSKRRKVVRHWYIAEAGLTQIAFKDPLTFGFHSNVILTLAAGGEKVKGSLSVTASQAF